VEQFIFPKLSLFSTYNKQLTYNWYGQGEPNWLIKP